MYLSAIAQCYASTNLITNTATTTVTAAESGACNNFVGACVVYGTGGAVPYTTTIYADSPATSTISVTPTTVTEEASNTAHASRPCEHFEGACVVYATGTDGTSYTTTIQNGDGDAAATGNRDGLIGVPGSSDGYIGEASSLNMRIILPLIALVLVNLGFVVWM
jgi:hypothetical protein